MHHNPLTGINIHFDEDETDTAIFFLECMANGFYEAGDAMRADKISQFINEVERQNNSVAHS